MGLAASQARYLTLTARKSDLEFQSQTINSRRIQLSYRTAEIARAYSEGMNNKRIQMFVPGTTTSGQATKVWKELSFNLLKSQGFMIIGTEGTALKPSPYLISGQSESKLHNLKEAYDPIDTDKKNEELAKNKTAHKLTASGKIASLSEEDYGKLSATIKNAGIYEKQGNEYKLKAYISDTAYTAIQSDNTYKSAYASTKTNPLEAAFVKGGDNSSKWTLANQIPDSVYQLLDDTSKALYESGTISNTTYSYSVNPNYTNPDELGPDIQALLVSGKAQIVTKDFMDFLVENGAYSYETGIQGGKSFSALLQEWETKHDAAIYDWRSDESETFQQRNYTEDDEAVIAKYEADTAEVQAQDKILEMEEKNIETQHKAIETELENVKKVVQKNIEDTFKIFS